MYQVPQNQMYIITYIKIFQKFFIIHFNLDQAELWCPPFKFDPPHRSYIFKMNKRSKYKYSFNLDMRKYVNPKLQVQDLNFLWISKIKYFFMNWSMSQARRMWKNFSSYNLCITRIGWRNVHQSLVYLENSIQDCFAPID